MSVSLHPTSVDHLLVDAGHAGSTDLARWPLSEVEIRLAAESLHDPDAVIDLYRVCQSKDRCEVARAYVYARLVLGSVGIS
jgi:hypothetical protein